MPHVQDSLHSVRLSRAWRTLDQDEGYSVVPSGRRAEVASRHLQRQRHCLVKVDRDGLLPLYALVQILPSEHCCCMKSQSTGLYPRHALGFTQPDIHGTRDHKRASRRSSAACADPSESTAQRRKQCGARGKCVSVAVKDNVFEY